MRILAVRGKNLASLPHFDVDLAGPILGGAGLFAITGPTGAGKSTLLDAICLALYDETPRLSGKGGVEIGLKGDPTNLKANNVRGILRRGTGSGYAEVDFIGGTGARYRARWSIRRARDKASGRFQNQKITLDSLDEDRSLTQKTKSETLVAIEAAVGLSFDQFRRSALLAQGEFDTFLRAKSGERGALLERMTGTEIYRKLSIAAHQRASGARLALANIDERLGERPVLGTEARTRLQEQCQIDQVWIKAAERALATQKAAGAWWTRRGELALAVGSAATELAATQSAHAEAKGRREVLRAIEEIAPLRPLRADLIRTKEDVARAERLVVDRVAAQVLARKAETIAVSQLALAEAGQVAAQQGLAASPLAEALDQAQSASVVAEAATIAARAARTLAEERAKATPIPPAGAHAERHSQLGQLLTQVRRAQQLVEELSTSEAARGETIKERAEARRRGKEAAKRATAAGVALEQAKVNLEQLQKTFDLDAYRADLVEGEPCAVCGSRSHPGVTPVDASILGEQRARVKALAGDERRAEKAESSELAAVKAADRRITEYEAQLKKRALALGALRSDWEMLRMAVGDPTVPVDPTEEHADKILKTLIKQTHAKREADERARSVAIKIHQARDRARDRLDQAQNRLEQIRKAKEDAKRAVEKALAEQVKAAKARWDKASEASTVARAERAAADSRVTDAQRHGRRAHQVYSQAQIAWEEAVVSHQIDLETMTDLLGYSTEWIAIERAALSALDTAVGLKQAILTARHTDLERHDAASDRPTVDQATVSARQDIIIEALEAFREAYSERRHTLRSDDEAKNRRKHWVDERVAQVAEVKIWGSLDEIIGSASGDKFQTFAQSLTLDAVIEQANMQLIELARRYRLMRVPGKDLELQVIDRDMGDEIRSVQSLSGGESFLVSLALALGLASLSARDTRVESLFIDEGLGSLDIDTLDAVLSTLDGLQSGGRQIGLISHVPGLAARIGAQIQVKPCGGESRVQVLGPQ